MSLENLIKFVGVLKTEEIIINEKVRESCKNCPFYEIGLSCTPKNPYSIEDVKELLKEYNYAVIVGYENDGSKNKEIYIKVLELDKKIKNKHVTMTPITLLKEWDIEKILYTGTSYGINFVETLKKFKIKLFESREKYINYAIILIDRKI